MKLEKDIENEVVKWAQKHGFLTPKVKFVEAGWPDRLFLGHGCSIFIEFKRPGQEPDPLQRYRLAVLIEHGIPAFWADNAAAAIDILKAAMESSRVPAKSNQDDVESSGSGAVSGSRLGQDLDLFGSPEDSALKGAGFTCLGDSAPPSNVLHVARGDKEMGQLQQLDLFRAARDPEGDGPNYGLADSLD